MIRHVSQILYTFLTDQPMAEALRRSELRKLRSSLRGAEGTKGNEVTETEGEARPAAHFEEMQSEFLTSSRIQEIANAIAGLETARREQTGWRRDPRARASRACVVTLHPEQIRQNVKKDQ